MKGLCKMSDIISQEHKLEQEEKCELPTTLKGRGFNPNGLKS